MNNIVRVLFLAMSITSFAQTMSKIEKAEMKIKAYSERDSIFMDKTVLEEFAKKIKDSLQRKDFDISKSYKKNISNSFKPIKHDPNVMEAVTRRKRKYCTLVVQCANTASDSKLFLNGIYVCTYLQAKNGLVLHSGKEYKVQLVNGQAIICDEPFISLDGGNEILDCDYLSARRKKREDRVRERAERKK